MTKLSLRERVLQSLRTGNRYLKEISYAAKADESTVHKVLKQLQREGLVKRVGWGEYSLIQKEVEMMFTEFNKEVESLQMEVKKTIEEIMKNLDSQ